MATIEVARWAMGSLFVVHGALFVAPPAPVRARLAEQSLSATGFRRLGFDSASKSSELTLCLECSPLSCNEMAIEMSANAHCLFETLGEAAGVEGMAAQKPPGGQFHAPRKAVALDRLRHPPELKG